MSGRQKVVLYGAGEQNCGSALRYCGMFDCEVVFIVDRGGKPDDRFLGVPIYPPSYLPDFDSYETDQYYLLITARNQEVVADIRRDIKLLGLSNAIVCDVTEFALLFECQLTNIHTVNFMAAYQCNLNCARCCALSPLVPFDYPYPKAEAFERDVKRLSALIGDGLSEFHIEGGEPTLNPQISELVKIIRRYFPGVSILIITNGLTVKSLPEELWRVLCEYDVTVELTPYPIKLHYYDVYNYIKSKAVQVHWSGVPDEKRQFFKFVNFGAEKTPDVHRVERLCRIVRGGELTLRDSKLFRCAQGAVVDFFNDHFSAKLPRYEENGIDIFAVSNKQELLRRLSESCALCSYCGLPDSTLYKWEISARGYEEWATR